MPLPRSKLAAAAALVVAIPPALFAAIAVSARADGSGPVLHEDIETPPEQARRTAELLRGSILGPEPRAGSNPTAFAAGSRILPRPELAAGGGARRVYERDKARNPRRDSSFRADRDTRADGTLGYDAVFNPSVAPHKRMSALDAVAPDYTLQIGSPRLEPRSVGGKPDPERDLFWASLTIELAPGRDVAIPSVAPDMRILSYEIEPDIPIDFFADGADNVYVRAARGGGEARLVMLVDADARYFGAAIPRGLRVRDADQRLLHPMPEGPRGQASEALARLGLHRDLPLADALGALIAYFRAFDTGELPAGTGDIYWDLFTSKLGVCRHRAFAFAITAQALGIPARYVQNEAHAFAEVHIPEIGWMRVDLGGAALDLDIDEPTGTTEHRPRQPDPFAQSGGGGDPGGEAPRRRAPRQPAQSPSSPAQTGGVSEPPAPQEDATAPRPDATGGGGSFSGPASDRGAGASPSSRAPSAQPAGEPDERAPLSVAVTSADAEGFRGETVRVAGRISSRGEPVPHHRVEIALVPAAGEPVAVGRAVTGADGRFEADVALAPTLELGDYRVVARAAGTDAYRPATSE